MLFRSMYMYMHNHDAVRMSEATVTDPKEDDQSHLLPEVLIYSAVVVGVGVGGIVGALDL